METDNIVEFPAELAEKAKLDAQEFRKTGKQTGPVPEWAKTLRNEHLDSESMFVARQLEYIRAGVHKVQYTDLVYDRLLPINRSVSPAKREYTIRIMDGVGEATVVGEDTETFPMVDAELSERTMRFFNIGLGYRYSIDEIRAAAEAGIPLVATRALLCRQLIERKANDVAMVGDLKAGSATGGTKGLLNIAESGILSEAAGVGTGSGTTAFGTKNPDEVLKDLHNLTSKAWTNSKGMWSVNTLLLPLSTRIDLATRRVGDGTNGSILSYFVGADPFIGSEADVVGLWQLESAAGAGATGAWTGKRAIAYRRDPSAIEFMISQDFEQLPPQAVNMFVRTACRMKLGGIALYLPATMCRMDEI